MRLLSAWNKDLRMFVGEVEWSGQSFYLLCLVYIWIGLCGGWLFCSLRCLYVLPSFPFSPFFSLAHCDVVLFFPLWTQCTTSCGPGYQMRAVKCVVGSYGAVMDDTECNAATRPTDTQVRRTLSSFLPGLFSSSLPSFFILPCSDWCYGEKEVSAFMHSGIHRQSHISTWSQ